MSQTSENDKKVIGGKEMRILLTRGISECGLVENFAIAFNPRKV